MQALKEKCKAPDPCVNMAVKVWIEKEMLDKKKTWPTGKVC